MKAIHSVRCCTKTVDPGTPADRNCLETISVMGNTDIADAAHAPTSRDYDRQVPEGKREQTIGVAAGAGGALFTALAVWRFVAVAHRSPPAREKQGFRVLPTRGGAFASYAVSF